MMCSFRCFFDCKTSSYLITSCTYNTKETTTDALLYNLMFILFDIIIYIRDYLYIVRHYRKIKCEKFEDGERKIGHGKKKKCLSSIDSHALMRCRVSRHVQAVVMTIMWLPIFSIINLSMCVFLRVTFLSVIIHSLRSQQKNDKKFAG